MTTGDPVLDLVIGGLFAVFGAAVVFEIAVRWLIAAVSVASDE